MSCNLTGGSRGFASLATSDMEVSTSGQVDPEMQSESRPREDCNPKRAVGMRDFSTTLPIEPERRVFLESDTDSGGL